MNQVRFIQQGSPYFGKVYFMDLPGDKNSFFEVLHNGKNICVLKKVVKVKSEVYMYAGAVKKEIKAESDLLFWANAEFFKMTKDCMNLPASISGNPAVKKYIDDNKLKCNREADMIKLAAFVNSIEL